MLASDPACPPRSSFPRTLMTTAPTPLRFEVSLSFPGEHRTFVEGVAVVLAARFGREGVLYDQYHDVEFARPDLDVYLPNLYRTQSKLVVLFLCPEYMEKRWCKLEWRFIRQLIATMDAARIMFLSFGKAGDYSEFGIFSGDGAIDVSCLTPEVVAKKIVCRLDLNGHQTRPVASAISKPLRAPNKSPALGTPPRPPRAGSRPNPTPPSPSPVAPFKVPDHHVLDQRVLFEVYSPDSEPYCVTRPLDLELWSAAKRGSVWVYGASGVGKTTAIRRCIAQARRGSLYIGLANCAGVSIDDMLFEMEARLQDATGRARASPRRRRPELLRDISTSIDCLGADACVYLDELPLDDPTSEREFIQALFALLNFHANRATIAPARFFISTIGPPAKFATSSQRQVVERITFTRAPEWTQHELVELANCIAAAYDVLVPPGDLTAAVVTSSGSPRFLRICLSRLIHGSPRSLAQIAQDVRAEGGAW